MKKFTLLLLFGFYNLFAVNYVSPYDKGYDKTLQSNIYKEEKIKLQPIQIEKVKLKSIKILAEEENLRQIEEKEKAIKQEKLKKLEQDTFAKKSDISKIESIDSQVIKKDKTIEFKKAKEDIASVDLSEKTVKVVNPSSDVDSFFDQTNDSK